MKKYNTRPIDFTGCHPVIAEHLKRGEEIECKVWDTTGIGSGVGFVVGYFASDAYPYRTRVDAFRYAEPIARKVRRIMPPERAIPVLIANGWRFDHLGQMHGPRQLIVSAMFYHMGSRLDAPDTISWSWPSCIIEEVEDE